MDKNSPLQSKSYAFALRIVKLYEHLEAKRKYFPLNQQLLRSGTSIAANIQEAVGGYSRKDFAAKLQISYKEAKETKFWICLLRDADMLESRLAESLEQDCIELLKIIVSILKTTKEREK